jgi:hypothetical protein
MAIARDLAPLLAYSRLPAVRQLNDLIAIRPFGERDREVIGGGIGPREHNGFVGKRSASSRCLYIRPWRPTSASDNKPRSCGNDDSIESGSNATICAISPTDRTALPHGRLPSYLETGLAGRESLLAALRDNGKGLDVFHNVLDAGWVCWRVFRKFNPFPSQWKIHGADTDIVR